MTFPHRALAAWGCALAIAAQAETPVGATTAGAASTTATLPPAELFYQRPAIERTALSPSGRWLAMGTRGAGNRTMLVVFDLQAWKPLAVAARFADADIDEFYWVNDERLVFHVTDHTRGGGDQRLWPGLFSVRRDGTGQRMLVRTRPRAEISDERWVGAEPLAPDHVLLHVPVDGGGEVIVGQYQTTQTREPATLVAKRLNIETGRTRNLSDGIPPHVRRWWFTPQGQPRALLTQHQGRSTYLWREGAAAAEGGDASAAPRWRTLAEGGTFEMPFGVNRIDGSGTMYVTHSAGPNGEAVLSRFNFDQGRPEAQPLVSTPGFDFTGSLVEDPADGRALGVRVITDAQTTVWFDPVMKAAQDEADRRLPGMVNQLVCRPCSGRDMAVVVRSWSDRDPGQIWMHWPASQRWRMVGAVRPEIDPARMGTTDFERIRARDGLEFPVWITRPAGPASAGPRPAVVLVHGGPWVRGRHWRWNDDVQFLASRGYVVIEPEFRGSTGYGQRLYRAGWKQWGQAMQDDVADAVAWAVKRGDVDGKRVCIAGASYGGYSTLMGLIRDPDVYRCGAAWAAVTDPRLRYQWRQDSDANTEVRDYSLPLLVGDPVKDAAMLDAVTPVLHAARIQAPLLLAFGAEDRRVPLVHGTRMREALRSAGREPQYIVYGDEGHGWFKLQNQIDFANRLERFLAEQLR